MPHASRKRAGCTETTLGPVGVTSGLKPINEGPWCAGETPRWVRGLNLYPTLT